MEKEILGVDLPAEFIYSANGVCRGNLVCFVHHVRCQIAVARFI